MSNQVKSTPQIVMAGEPARLAGRRAQEIARVQDVVGVRVGGHVAPHRSPSRIRTALNELAERGYVQRLDRFRVTPYGRQAHVWGLS